MRIIANLIFTVAIIAGLANVNWSEMDGQARFLFCAGITLSVLKAIDMLVDTTIAHLRKHENDNNPATPIPP